VNDNSGRNLLDLNGFFSVTFLEALWKTATNLSQSSLYPKF
jgi:hypothetical protein